MRTITRLLVIGFALALTPSFAHADKTKKTVEHGAKTGADAVVDGTRTFGRATRAFFKGGAPAAKKTWKKNAHKTRDDARANAKSTRAAAHSGK